MPDTDLALAQGIAERLRETVAAEPFRIGQNDQPIDVTISVGLATFDRGDDTPDTILKRADSALYRAKRSGRNRRAWLETAHPMVLVDSHCHLDFPDFAAERDQIVARAHAAGVARMVTISTRVRRFDEIRAIAEAYPEVYCSVGTHCLHAAEEPEVSVDELCRLAEHPKCVAIGECGLDYHYDYSPRDVMERGFRTHIAAARLTGLPLVIHAREADDDVARILTEETEAHGAFPMILHCFT
eukprot:gene35403-41773_t